MAKDKRFKTVYTQGTMSTVEILVDQETGVHYLFRTSGYCGGLTPLLDASGKPVVELISD